MNRRWRRLLASGLMGAVVSLLLGRDRKRRKAAGQSTLMAWMGPFLPSLIGEMSKEGLWRKLLPLRRRIK